LFRIAIHLAYNLLVAPCLVSAELLLSLWIPKINTRRKSWRLLLQHVAGLPRKARTIWFHASSMGEFEQCKPVIEQIKQNDEDCTVVVSFSSPSGYDNVGSYSWIDTAFYLPIDTLARMRFVLDAVKPDIVFINRYDIWWNMMYLLAKNDIPTVIINATYPSSPLFRLPIFSSYVANLYKKVKCVFPVSLNDYTKFCTILVSTTTATYLVERCSKVMWLNVISYNVIQSSDTRLDRLLLATKSIPHSIKDIQLHYSPNDIVIVVGSSWSEDEKIVLDGYTSLVKEYDNLRLIIVPHEPTELVVASLLSEVEGSMPLSSVTNDTEFKHIIVDSIGKLLSLYSLATCAYVGGGNGVGVHSVTEPAVWGIPVACGKNIYRSIDAKALHNLGGLAIVQTPDEFIQWIKNSVIDIENRTSIGIINSTYIQKNSGGTSGIIEWYQSWKSYEEYLNE
jgi:3-deoxy-D-manno-octulosonic-acid transferase